MRDFATAPNWRLTAVNYRPGSPRLRFPQPPEEHHEAAAAVRDFCADRGAAGGRDSPDRVVGGRLPPRVDPCLSLPEAKRYFREPRSQRPVIAARVDSNLAGDL